MTLLQLEAAAVKKGLPTEFISREFPESNMLGIKNGKHVWHWFTEFSRKNTTYISFDHSYSQNTGKTLRGITQSIYIKEALGKKLNLDLWS
jgi:hypothetical protein